MGNPYDRGRAYLLGHESLTVRYKGNPKSNLYEMVIDRFSQTTIFKAVSIAHSSPEAGSG